MAITNTREQLFSGTHNGQHIQIFVDPLSRIQGLIGNTPVQVRGLPQTITSLSSVLYSLEEHCRVTTNFGTIQVLVRLRGGMPRSPRTPVLRPLDANCIPPIERACATVGGALEKLGFGLTLIGAVGGTVYPPLKILEVAGMICVFGGAGLSVRKYQLEHTRIASQAYSNLQEIQAVEYFIKKELPKDLITIGDGIEDAILASFKEEFGDLQSQRIQPQKIQAMRNFFGAASHLYSYKNKSGAEQLMLCGTSLCDALEAGFKLKTPFSLFEQIEPVSAIVKAGAAIGFSLHSYFNPPEDATQKVIDLFRADLRQLSREVQSGVRSLAVLLKAGFADVMQEITATRTGLAVLTNLSQREFSGIQANQRSILAAIDIQNMTGVQFKLSWMILKIKNSSVGTFDQKEYGDFILELLTWAKDGSKMGEVTCSNKTDVVTVLKRSAPFCIGFLAVHLRTNPGLANPLVWAEATDAYIELRMRNPGNYDAQILSDTVHTDLLGIMRQVGETTQAWIQRIQADKTLFSNLVKDHLQVIQDLQSEWSKAITAKATTLSPQLKILLSKFEETYYLLRRFTEIAFSRSHKSDFFFMSLFSDQHSWAHRLVTRDELEPKLISALRSQDALEEFWENLTETLELLSLSIEQKIDSHQKVGGNTDDQYYLLSVTLYKFDLFLHERYPSKFSAPVPHKVKSAHITNVAQLCKGKIFLAAKLGMIKEVQRLLNGGKKVNQRSPKTGRTILHEAVRYHHKALVEFLLQVKGIQVDLADNFGCTPFDLAKGNAEIQDLLRKQVPIVELGKGKEFRLVMTSSDRLPGFNVYERGRFQDRAVTVEYSSVKIWDLNLGKCIKTLPRSVSNYSLKKNILVSYPPNQKISKIFDLGDPSLSPIVLEERFHKVHAIDLRNNRLLVDQPQSRVFLAFDLTTGKVTHRLNYREGGVLYPHGKEYPMQEDYENLVITGWRPKGGGLGKIETWDLNTGQKVRTIQADLNTGYICTSGYRAVIMYSNRILLYDLSTGQQMFTAQLEGRLAPMCSMAARSKQEVYFWKDKLMAPIRLRQNRKDFGIWDLNTQKLIGEIDNIYTVHPWAVPSYECRKEGKAVLVANHPSTKGPRVYHPYQLRVYDFELEKDLGLFDCGGVLGNVILRGSKLIVQTIGPTPTIKCFDVYSGKCLYSVPEPTISGLTFTDESLIGVDKKTLQLKVWELQDASSGQ